MNGGRHPSNRRLLARRKGGKPLPIREALCPPGRHTIPEEGTVEPRWVGSILS